MTILDDRRAAIVARARELDDIYPDHICPGCGADIIGWGGHDGHVAGPGPARWTFERGAQDAGECEWTHVMLSARSLRRRVIAEAEADADAAIDDAEAITTDQVAFDIVDAFCDGHGHAALDALHLAGYRIVAT